MADLIDFSLSKSVKGINDPLEKLRRMVQSELNFMYEWESAILLLYQETHILKKPYLKKLRLLKQRGTKSKEKHDQKALHRKSVLLISGETYFGKGLLPFLLAKGAKMVIYGRSPSLVTKASVLEGKDSNQGRFFPGKGHGQMTANTQRELFYESGPYDIITYYLVPYNQICAQNEHKMFQNILDFPLMNQFRN